jgi:hypothetical protein
VPLGLLPLTKLAESLVKSFLADGQAGLLVSGVVGLARSL